MTRNEMIKKSILIFKTIEGDKSKQIYDFICQFPQIDSFIRNVAVNSIVEHCNFDALDDDMLQKFINNFGNNINEGTDVVEELQQKLKEKDNLLQKLLKKRKYYEKE